MISASGGGSTSVDCTGADALFVFITSGGGGTEVEGVTATYNGVSMDIKFTDTTHATKRCRCFRLLMPASGSNSLALTWSGASSMVVVAIPMASVNQSTPDGSQVAADGSSGGTSSSINIPDTTANDIVLDFVTSSNGITGLTQGANQTSLNIQSGHGSGANASGCSYEVGGGTPNVMSWTWNEFAVYFGWAFAVYGASGATGPAPRDNTKRRFFFRGIRR